MSPFFFTYLLGPIAAFLPARWRNPPSLAGKIQWTRAAALSAVLEFSAALISLAYWYMYLMSRVVDSWVNGSLAGKVTDHQLTAGALIIFTLNPLTWLFSYFLLEGAVRLCGALFAESILGTLPLYLIERMIFLIKNHNELKPHEALRSNVQSIAGSVREHIMLKQLAQVPDELHYSQAGSEELLEIWSCRKNTDWIAPAVMRVDDLYYRLENSSVEKGTRPFRYRLRRLPIGVPGRKVLLYKTADAVVHE
jgi:hypothetical protein